MKVGRGFRGHVTVFGQPGGLGRTSFPVVSLTIKNRTFLGQMGGRSYFFFQLRGKGRKPRADLTPLLYTLTPLYLYK